MHLRLNQRFIVNLECLDLFQSHIDGKTFLFKQNFPTLSLFSFSESILCRNYADPIEVKFALLAEMIKSTVQKGRIVETLHCNKLIESACRPLQPIRQHVAHMQNRLVVIDLDWGRRLLSTDFWLFIDDWHLCFLLHRSFMVFKCQLQGFFHLDCRHFNFLIRFLLPSQVKWLVMFSGLLC